MNNILVTGGAGFIGSNFVPYFIEKYENYNLIVLDKLTYAGSLDNLKEVLNHPRFTFVKGDICDKDLVNDLFEKFMFQGVIHFAAESHVDNSISGPEAFIRTNVVGTFNLIEAARKLWMNAPNEVKEDFQYARFHHISTDEVFGSLGETGYFTEETPYAPNSPYSASKASSDMLVRSYFHTFGLNVVTTNCSNNYGPKQHAEKLIPTIIRRALSEEQIPIYGDGKNVRDWLYVLDHCKAVDLVFHKGNPGETYNIGGNTEKTNLEIVNTICEILDSNSPRENKISYKELIAFVEDRAGHDRRYAIDSAKIEDELSWKRTVNFENGIEITIKEYKN
ncbi:MAG: dTDP-glucose 4,6-dehydratase [Flavobacteriia bacterium]|jgi:dTDP-glucose 4,6-dehydratase